MDRDQKIALQAACVIAAANLIANQPIHPSMQRFGQQMEPDTAACARYARDLFGKLTNEPWE